MKLQLGFQTGTVPLCSHFKVPPFFFLQSHHNVSFRSHLVLFMFAVFLRLNFKQAVSCCHHSSFK